MVFKQVVRQYNTETGEPLQNPTTETRGFTTLEDLKEQVAEMEKKGVNAIGFRVLPVTKKGSKYSHFVAWGKPFSLGN